MTTTKADRIKWIKTALTLLITALVWIIPSNVAYLIAQNRDVLLGRYSLGHFTIALIIIPIAAASLYLTWGNEKNEKERKFKVLAITISILLALIVTDTAARLIARPKRYVEEETYFHRPPNAAQTGTARDVPDKPHLLLPLITEIVPPEHIRAFMELKQTKLPPAEKLYETLIPRLEVQESAAREFCRSESIEFLSLTQPLRKATADGTQTYFTYDQHWTPPGHIIVADTISQHLATTPAP